MYEFITVEELSLILKVDYKKIINICILLGVKVTINYRLDSELILLICDELNYTVNFIDEINELLKINNNKKKKKKNFLRNIQ
ncbi:MAG: translation initiation factor IF-2 N-terminal domain-containing protein [Candidatus Shikimatogenerans bostrichidophilus]|nr:MAG: translation initiation factor IF-2 N-terminal domain-containing protein [Candidatus Shikimatogenerans bostrichidophilus]